jgi:hypothetical protein
MRTHLKLVLLGLAGACLTIAPARSEPLRIALIIANGHYTGMPELARCAASAASVRDALHEKGFEVVERSDLGRGQFDAAIGALARRAAAAPPAFAALYYCGYGLEFNGRSFLLPTSANIARDNDVLTQGVISKSVVDSLARVADSSGFVLLDAFQPPGTAASGMARLAEQIQPSHFAVIGVTNDGATQGLAQTPTAASQALREQVAGDKVSLERFINGMRDQLAKDSAVATYVVDATGQPSFLVGGQPPPPPPAVQTPPPQPTAVAVQPPPPPPEPRVVAPPPPPAPSAPPPRQMVDEDRMSDQDRRQVQLALATMGYYSGRIDTVFGPETRAAIRRFQFEIKAELTGYLNAEQATKLVNGVR